MAKVAPARYESDTEKVGDSEAKKTEYVLEPEYKRIRDYFNKVYNSEEYKKRRKNFKEWKDLYSGELYDETLPDTETKAQINYIFSTIETIVPLLTDNKPQWYPKARSPVFQNMATIFKLALDYLWDSLEQDTHTSDVVKDAMTYDAGIEYVGYDKDSHDVEISLVDPSTFICAPGYTDNWKAPWQGTKEDTPMSWIQDNFPDKLDEVKPKSKTSVDGEPTLSSEKSFLELVEDTVEVYTIWIKDPAIEEYLLNEGKDGEKGEDGEKVSFKKKYKNGRIIVMTDTCRLSDEESPFDHGLPPWVMYYDYRDPHNVWGIGEPQMITELHREVNRQLQAVLKQSRLHHDPNYTYDENANLPDNIEEEFPEGGHLWAVTRNPNGQDPIEKVDVGDIDSTLTFLLAFLPDAIGEVSSVKELMKGEPAKKERQSASEISVMIESSYTRVRQKVRNLEASLKRRGKLIISLMQQFYKTPRDISFNMSTEEGERLQYLKVANNKTILEQTNKPRMTTGVEGEPLEAEDQYKQRVAQDPVYQETLKLIQGLEEDPDAMYWPFEMAIDTNSTLPMDKQTLANLLLRLAQIQTTPQSIVDDVAVIEQLDIPNGAKIIARKRNREKQAAMMAQKQNMPQRRVAPPSNKMGPAGGVPNAGLNQGGPTV